MAVTAFHAAVSSALAAIFLLFRMKVTVTGPRVSPGAVYAGTADLPVQYRDLTNIIVRLAVRITGIAGGTEHIQWYWSLEFLAVTATLTIAALFLGRLGASSLFVFPMYGMILANYCFQPFYNALFFYDMPALLFMTAGLWLLYDGRWIGYYLLLPFAILNRETAAALVLVFAFAYWDCLPKRVFLLHCACQAAIIVAIKAALFAYYLHNPGGLVSFYDKTIGLSRLVLNARFLTIPSAFLLFGFMWAPFLLALVRIRDRFFKRSVWVIPPFFAGMMLVGNIYEFRVFTEVIPIMTFVIALGFSPHRKLGNESLSEGRLPNSSIE